jgi:hypothetical protein
MPPVVNESDPTNSVPTLGPHNATRRVDRLPSTRPFGKVKVRRVNSGGARKFHRGAGALP